MPRTTYTQDERDSAARSIRSGHSTVETVAHNYGVQVPVVRRWIRDLEVREGARVRVARGPRVRVDSSYRDRAFGVEFEFVGSRAAVVAAMQAAGFDCELQGYNHHDSDTLWKVVTDASVYNGGELVSPVLRGREGREAIARACEALRAAGARVNRSCGTHVHHDARGLTLANIRDIVRVYTSAQHIIDAMVAPSRRAGQNGMCRSWTGHDLTTLASITGLNQLNRIDRYRTLNVQSYARHQTVEIRQHQGTLNARKTLAWIAFGQAIIEAALTGRAIAETSVEAFVNSLDLDARDRRTLVANAARFETRTYSAVPVREAVTV